MLRRLAQHSNSGRTMEALMQLPKEELAAMCLRLQPASKPKASKKPAKKANPFNMRVHNQRKVAFKVAYLGERYRGLAYQLDTEETVEAELFKALSKACLISSRDTCGFSRCGRTDKGVSAFDQVISLHVRTALEECDFLIPREQQPAKLKPKTEELPYVHVLNRLLPDDIRVLAWAPAPFDFDARFSCEGRTYRYYFFQDTHNLDLKNEAAQHFVGEHDFRNFCKADIANVTNFKRRMFSVHVQLSDLDGFDAAAIYRPPELRMCEVIIHGTAFLWHQVRCMVSILFLVGKGLEAPKIVRELLDIEKHPCKPQYEMAAETPLVLHQCHFSTLAWKYEDHPARASSHHFLQLWRRSAMRGSLVMGMLAGFNTAARLALDNTGPADKPHTQLLDRPTAESIEARQDKLSAKLAAAEAEKQTEEHEPQHKKPKTDAST